MHLLVCLTSFVIGGKKPAKGDPVRSDRKRASTLAPPRATERPPTLKLVKKARYSASGLTPRISNSSSFGTAPGLPGPLSSKPENTPAAVPQWNNNRANEWARHKNVTLISFSKLWERIGGELCADLAREFDENEAEREVNQARAALRRLKADELEKLAQNSTPRVQLVMMAVCLLRGKHGNQAKRLLKDPAFVDELEKTDVSLGEFIQLQRSKRKADTLLSSFTVELRKMGYLRQVHAWKADTTAGAESDTGRSEIICVGQCDIHDVCMYLCNEFSSTFSSYNVIHCVHVLLWPDASLPSTATPMITSLKHNICFAV